MSTEEETTLLERFRVLSPGDRHALLAFAAFLAAREGAGDIVRADATPPPREVPEPEPIPRPESEKVVHAVKRLSRTYFMLDKAKMLNETSELVTQHVVHGREAGEVIDELEALFEKHYHRLKESHGG